MAGMNVNEKNSDPVQLELTVSAWGSAQTQLAQASGLLEDQIAEAATKGGVWIKKYKAHKLRRIRNLVANTQIGDQLYLNYDASVLAQMPLIPTLVSDQVNYSIWNKPAGMLSQGSKWSDHCTITEAVKSANGKPAYLVHRLDRAASGLIVVAHTKNALKKLTEMFASHAVRKHYLVTVHGNVDFELPMEIKTPVQEKQALTTVLESNFEKQTEQSRLLVSISTGRKHQIRHHLHSIGLPVVGDRLFEPERDHKVDLQLVASLLEFQCPFTNQLVLFEIPTE